MVGLFFRRDFLEIEEGDSERFRDFCDGFFVLSRKAEPALLVEQLKHTHKVFVVGNDRIGQDLLGLESRALVVGGIVEEGGMNPLQFRDVVGVAMFTGPQIFGAEAGQALLGDRNADLFDRVDMGHLGENLFLFRIEREQRQVLRIEEAEDIFVEIEENLIQVAGGVDLVRNPFDVFRELHLLLQFLQVLSRRFGLHSCAPLGETGYLHEDCRRLMRTAAYRLITRVETQSSPMGLEGKEKAILRMWVNRLNACEKAGRLGRGPC